MEEKWLCLVKEPEYSFFFYDLIATEWARQGQRVQHRGVGITTYESGRDTKL